MTKAIGKVKAPKRGAFELGLIRREFVFTILYMSEFRPSVGFILRVMVHCELVAVRAFLGYAVIEVAFLSVPFVYGVRVFPIGGIIPR